MPTVLKPFQGRLNEAEDGSPLPLPREVALFTVQFKYICHRSALIKKRYIFEYSKAEALKTMQRLRANTYRDAEGKKVCVASEIDVLKTTSKLVHTTRPECDADEEENEYIETRGFDPNND